MRSVDVNSTVDDLVQSAGTVQTVLVKNVMPETNSFWVLYGLHTKPTYLEDAGNGQQLQRDAALEYVKTKHPRVIEYMKTLSYSTEKTVHALEARINRLQRELAQAEEDLYKLRWENPDEDSDD